MANSKRDRLTVDPNGSWRLYTNTLPPNSIPLGTVTIGMETGALIRMKATGSYMQVNAGAMRGLDGRKVSAALGITGRPTEVDGGKRINVYLDKKSIERATKLGDGNVSEGIRRALGQAT